MGSVFTGRSGVLVLRALMELAFRHLSEVKNELIPVYRIDGDGKPHGLSIAVKSSPEYFVNRDPACLLYTSPSPRDS